MSWSIPRRIIAIAVVLLGVLIPLIAFAGNRMEIQSDSVEQSLLIHQARNVILLIGDGMGDSEITLARNYHVGADGRLSLDNLPFMGTITTYSVEESNPSLPNYVTDSAAAATALATGVKTSNTRIATTAGSDLDIQTVLETAQGAGFLTGLVSTAEIADATPASFASHINQRFCKGPEDMADCLPDKKLNGGPGSIAEQLVDHQIDVLLGGGKAIFEQVIDDGPFVGQTVTQSAIAQGYSVVETAAQLGVTLPGDQVLGLFTNGNMSAEWAGDPALPFPGSGPQICQTDQRPLGEPGIVGMTAKAIQLLHFAAKEAGIPGFFLVVEGASIDKQSHLSSPCQQIGETVAFDDAVEVAVNYANRHVNNARIPLDTLVIVTADHGQTAQIIWPPVSVDQPGAFSRLVTADGAVITVSYATREVGALQSHTGTQLRIAALGPQSARVIGLHDNTDIFHLMARVLGLE